MLCDESADGSRLSDVIIRQQGHALNRKAEAGYFHLFLPPHPFPSHLCKILSQYRTSEKHTTGRARETGEHYSSPE